MKPGRAFIGHLRAKGRLCGLIGFHLRLNAVAFGLKVEQSGHSLLCIVTGGFNALALAECLRVKLGREEPGLFVRLRRFHPIVKIRVDGGKNGLVIGAVLQGGESGNLADQFAAALFVLFSEPDKISLGL